MPMAPKRHQPTGTTPRIAYDQRRGTAQERGYDVRWVRESEEERLRQVADTGDFTCRYCQHNECTMMDHAIPPMSKGLPGSVAYITQFWAKEYWIPACSKCNTNKGNMTQKQLQIKKPRMYQRLMAVLKERGLV